jgi:hypothetical protein
LQSSIAALFLILRQQCLMDLIGQCIAIGLKPLATATAVVPPFPLHAGDVPLVESVVEKVLVASLGSRPLPYLSAKAKLVDTSLTAVGTFQEERHPLYLPKTLRVPARGMPQMIEASMVNAAMSSGSR